MLSLSKFLGLSIALHVYYPYQITFILLILCALNLLKEKSFVFLQRSYNLSLPHKKIPDALCQLAKRMAAPAMPYGEEFQPEAAIVNYFGLGMTYTLTS